MVPYLMLLAVVLLTVYGQLVIKAGAIAHATEASSGKLPYLVAMFSDIGVLSGLMAAVAASACWMLAIERLDVAYAYPFMALCFVLVPVGATFLFGERLPPIQLLGIGLIIVGVTVNALGR
ncbi:MAG: EamA family transporter [Xanthobacteraceae bacterium]